MPREDWKDDSTQRSAIAPEEVIPVPECYLKHGRKSWHQRRRIRSILSVLRNLPGTVLDYGCGYGDITHAIWKTHAVVGVDVDPARIAFAAREYAPIPFEVCRADGLDFADESFDVVLSSAVVHSVPDPLKHFKEVRRVLRKDGHLILLCANELVVQNAFRRLLLRSPLAGPLWIRREAEVRAILQSFGFKIQGATYFNNPPFVSWKNVGDLVVGIIEGALGLLRVRKAAGYFVLLAGKGKKPSGSWVDLPEKPLTLDKG